MNERKSQWEKHKFVFCGTILFTIGLIFIDLFGFNPERMENSLVTKNLVLPFISMNITKVMFVLSVISSMICFVENRTNWKVSSTIFLLLVRVALYFIPLLYIQGDFKIGVAYAIVQCVFSYFIGASNTTDYDKILNLLIILAFGLSIEVFAVLYLNQLSIFSSNIKWYMVIPIGKSNYITCVILPIYVAAVEYYKQNLHPIIIMIFSAFVFVTLLATGSRFALVLYIGYWLVIFFKTVIKKRKLERRKFARNCVLACMLVVVLLFCFIKYNNQIGIILNRFGVSTLFSNRINVYKESMEIIFQHVFLGRSAYSYHVFDAVKAHNWLLESLVQTGLIGTAVYLYALYSGMRIACRIKQRNIKMSITGFLVMYLIQGLAEPNLFGTLSDALFWLVVGVAFSVYKNEGKKEYGE